MQVPNHFRAQHCFIPSPDTIKNLLFAQHLSKLAENGYWIIFNYSWAIGTSNVDQNTAPTNIILMMISMQQRIKKQAWIFATTHWKDFSNSILFWNYYHATFLPFRTAYGLCLQVILMRVVWQSYGMLFTTTILHTMKKGWQLQFNCWEFQNVELSANLMISSSES